MPKVREREQAIELRKKGLSMNAIANTLGVSKSSVSTWVRDVQLTDNQKIELKKGRIKATEVGRLRGAEFHRQQRIKRLRKYAEDAKGNIASMSTRELFFLGLGLYWGEGFKSRSGSAGFSNSDPRVIQLMILWLEQCMYISRDRLRVQIFINDIHRDREQVILSFWKKETNLPLNQFRKVIFLPKSRKVYENRETYYGVCAIRILRGTEIKDRINALIQQSFDVHGQCRDKRTLSHQRSQKV